MAIGGFLGGLANLGAVTKGYEAQQAQEQQLQLAALRQKIAQDALAEEQRQRQLQQQSAAAAFGLLNDPNSPLAGLANIGGGQPNYAPGAIQGAPLGPPPTNPQLDLAQAAIARGYPPAAAAGMAGSLTGESGRGLDPYALNPTSGAAGMAQWLGPRRAGLMRMPQPFSRDTQKSYFFNELAGPEQATGQRMMSETDPRQAARDFTTGFERPGRVDTTSRENAAQAVFQQLDGTQQQQAQNAAISTATAVPPAYAGRLNLPQLAQLIKRNNPGISDEAGMGALVMLHNLMAPDAKAELEAYKFGVEEADKKAQRTETHEFHEAEKAHWKALENKAAGGTPPRFGTIDDLMRRWHDDFVQQNQREPSTDEIAKQRADLAKEAKPMSATQAGIVRRLEFGTGEVAAALNSITQLPYGTTLGMFGGAQGAMGKDLFDNMRKSLANKVTPESAQVLRALTGGLSRGLGIIASGGVAQGLQNFSDQMGQLVPVKDDTGLTIASKFADMRQLFDVSVNTMLADDQIPDPQKELMTQYREQVHKAIPFTTVDVAKLVGDPDDEHLSDFAKRMGLGQSNAWVKKGSNLVGPNGETQPLPPAFAADPDGTKYEK